MTKSHAFTRLRLSDWRQFSNVDIDFHPRLTILTGANASGKSTLLGILARHLNWNRQYSTAPLRIRGGKGEWVNLGPRRTQRLLEQAGQTGIGALTYTNQVTTEINVPATTSANRQAYEIYMPSQQEIAGVFLSSHRSSSGTYAQVPSIPTLFAGSDQILEKYTDEIRAQWEGNWTGRTPQVALKESLIAAAVFGRSDNESVDFNPEAAAIWKGFQRILVAVMPLTIGFRRLRIRVPDVILETETGDFILDEASGGLTAIVELSWQIFLRSLGKEQFTVLLDEPENHLHPSLQREILPSLLRAFPRVQFIVATHSPFVVTATPHSAVFVLDYNSQRRVDSRQLDYMDKSAGADEILTRVLGLPSTVPVWAERKFSEILGRHLTGSITSEGMAALRAELKANGLEAEFPGAVVQIVDEEATGHRE